mgnify:CR=1 FL=1
MALEEALDCYPKEIETRGGLNCLVRPLEEGDHEMYHAFFGAMQPQELIYIKHRVSDPAILKHWCGGIDLGRILPLLAIKDESIIGVSTLHQQLGGWKRHIGRISTHVRPDSRGKGLAMKLMEEVVDIARQCGLERMEAEFMSGQERGMKAAAHLGFAELYRLEDYVKDMQALTHDYIMMGLELITDEEYAGMG